MTVPSALARKLTIKPGLRVVMLNAPDGAIEALDPLPDDVRLTAEASETPADVVVVFARDAAAVDAWLPRALAAGTDSCVLWVAYPKGGAKAGTDINRDILHARLGERGLTGVSLVAYDGQWSAMRFRTS